MKNLFRLILALFLVGTLTINGQQPAMNYSEVIQVDSTSKKELYNRAKLSIVDAFISAKSVLQIDDKDEGQLVGKAILEYNPRIMLGSATTKGKINFTIKIFVKDSRYKYEVTDFFHDPFEDKIGQSFGLITNDAHCPYNLKNGLYTNPSNWYNRVWNDIKNQIDEQIVPLVASLKQGMTKPTEISKDDW